MTVVPPSDRPTPAPTREDLLARAHPVARAVEELVRQILGALGTAAPWESLHSPPEDMSTLLRLLSEVVDVVDLVPERFVSLQARFADSMGDGDTAQALVDARFYFEGIHAMVAGEIEDLRKTVEPLQRAPVELIALPPERKAYLCEVAADLKGKVTSALMGAAASLVASGKQNPVALEPILFEEKKEEFRRNRRLVKLLVEILDRLQKLQSEVGWEGNVRSWRDGGPIDPYALRPVVGFVDTLGKLLEGDVRRALYSGDYHAIQERRRSLTTRVNALSTLLLMESGRSEPDPSQRGLMIRRSAEISALLDREHLLPLVIGERSARKLRKCEDGDSESVPASLEVLLPLCEDEDLETFLKKILRAVLKRGSLVLERKKRRAAEKRARIREETQVRLAPVPPTGGGRAPGPPARPARRPTGPTERPGAPEVATPPDGAASRDRPTVREETATSAPPTPAPSTPSVPSPTPEETARLRAELADLLTKYRSPEDPSRKPFDFIHRMLDQKRTIPPGMVSSIHPFLRGLEENVLPRIERLGAAGDLPPSSHEQLQRSLTALGDPSPPPAWIRMEMAAAMGRLAQYLDAVATALRI